MKIVAKMGHWSSVVGGGVLLADEKGRMIGQIAFLCHDDAMREAVEALDDARQSLVDSSEEIAELRLTLSKTDLELPWLSDAIDKQTIALAKLRVHLEGDKE